MTTTVNVQAHCRDGVQVQINVSGDPCAEDRAVVLQDGEKWSGVVYDLKSLTISEVEKPAADQ